NGIFAFAAFDRLARVLHLARDRLGIKPLYWTRQNTTFAFASELKALPADRNFACRIDTSAPSLYLRLGCAPAPHSVYRDISKLLPGERLEASQNGIVTKIYWDAGAVAVAGQRTPDLRPEADIVEELDALLADTVKRQMVSDVPLGAFLSGGIDSSTVVAL